LTGVAALAYHSTIQLSKWPRWYRFTTRLKNAIAGQGDGDDPVEVKPMTLAARRFIFEYHVKIPAHDSDLDLWIPAPCADAYQKVLSTSTSSPVLLCLREDLVHHNQILYGQLPASTEEQQVVLRHDIERSARRARPLFAGDQGVAEITGLEKFLAPDSRVPVDGPIVEDALRVVDRDAPPRQRARQIFDHLIRSMVYDPRGCTPERANDLGDLGVACDIRKGTCTEFHGLFVAHARALGLPARFAFGFNIPPRTKGQIAGYHCWAEVYLPETGWFAVDVSEAWKRDDPEERSFYFGNLDANRVQFTTGRDISLVPPQRTGPVDRFIFPHAEAAGQRVEVDLQFEFVDVEQRWNER
jgi:transglutaminase-like putative cysteine protease